MEASSEIDVGIGIASALGSAFLPLTIIPKVREGRDLIDTV